jgi:hypothetical protein
MSCAIVGDSIAVGIHQYHQECAQYAKVGISAKGWTLKYPEVKADKVLISLGSNGGGRNNLAVARLKITSPKVYWVMPIHATQETKVNIIRLVLAYGDKLIYYTNTRDGIHPKNYKSVASRF